MPSYLGDCCGGVTSFFSASGGFWAPCRQLGRWETKLIQSITESTAAFFSQLAQYAEQKVTQALVNLGRWERRLCYSIASRIKYGLKLIFVYPVLGIFHVTQSACFNLNRCVDTVLKAIWNSITFVFRCNKSIAHTILAKPLQILGRWERRQINKLITYVASFFIKPEVKEESRRKRGRRKRPRCYYEPVRRMPGSRSERSHTRSSVTRSSGIDPLSSTPRVGRPKSRLELFALEWTRRLQSERASATQSTPFIGRTGSTLSTSSREQQRAASFDKAPKIPFYDKNEEEPRRPHTDERIDRAARVPLSADELLRSLEEPTRRTPATPSRDGVRRDPREVFATPRTMRLTRSAHRLPRPPGSTCSARTPRSSWSDRYFTSTVSGSLEVVLKSNIMFVSEDHFKWYERQGLNQFLMLQVAHIDAKHDTAVAGGSCGGGGGGGGAAAAAAVITTPQEVRDQRIINVRDFLLLGYLMHLLPLTDVATRTDHDEVLRAFYRLSIPMKEHLLKYYRGDRRAWDGEIPGGIWNISHIKRYIRRCISRIEFPDAEAYTIYQK